MTAKTSQPVTPRDLTRILFRHWRKMTLFFSGVVALTLLTIALYPRSYASESKLLIRMGRESVALDPTATTGETIMLQKTQEDEVNSALNILNSREVLERVAERVGAERIIANAAVGTADSSTANSTIAQLSTWVSSTMQTLRLSDPGTPVDRAVRRLEKKSRFTAPKQSMVITVKYTAASPQLAHDVVQAITDVFLEEHSRLSQTDGSLKFFAQQTDKLHTQLMTAQSELRDRKNAYQRTSDSSRLSLLENARDAMREKIYDLQLQESDLRSRYTDDYPLLQEIRRQREAAEQRLLTDMPASDVRQASYTAPSGGDTGVQLAHATAAPDGAPTATVEPAINKLESEVQKINDEEYELAQLEREVALLEGKYKMHVEKLEQARVNDELGREKIMNVKVAQPASLVHKPVSPMKAVILGLGTLLAFCGSLGLAFASESVDQTLRTTDQVEAQLGLPVLASLPYRKRRRRRRAKAAGQKHAGTHASHGGYQAMLRALSGSNENGRRSAKTVGVVGCETAKSRSRVAGDLAIQAACSGADPVLLIDADVRRRRIAKRFRLNGAPGWCEIMRGNAAAKTCIQPSKLTNLAVLGPGGGEADLPEPGRALVPQGRLDDLKSDFGLVVIDLPPASELNGSMVANMVDEVVLVVEAERTRIQAAQRARDLLNRAGIHVAGVVLANRREYIPRWLYQRL